MNNTIEQVLICNKCECVLHEQNQNCNCLKLSITDKEYYHDADLWINCITKERVNYKSYLKSKNEFLSVYGYPALIKSYQLV